MGWELLAAVTCTQDVSINLRNMPKVMVLPYSVTTPD